MSSRRGATTRIGLIAATAACFAFVTAIGASPAQAETCGDAAPALADDRPADPSLVRELEANLVVLSAELSADLSARVTAKADGVVKQVAKEQLAASLAQVAQNLEESREISNHSHGLLTERNNEVRKASGAHVDECIHEKSIEIANCS